LNIREAVLGKEHPDTLSSMNDLTLVLNSQGKYDEAEAMHRRALDGHPSTLTSVGNLASVPRDQGKYEEAEAMSRRALDGYEIWMENTWSFGMVSIFVPSKHTQKQWKIRDCTPGQVACFKLLLVKLASSFHDLVLIFFLSVVFCDEKENNCRSYF